MASARSANRDSRSREREELVSLGIITAALSHELNNCLSSILTVAGLILEKLPEQDANYERIRTVVRQAERARRLVKPLARPRAERIEINQQIAIVVDAALGEQRFKGIEITTKLGARVPPITGDPVLIGQAISGVLVHALGWMTTPGVIEIATGARKGFVEIRVNSSGPGMPGELIGRAFNPLSADDGTKGTSADLAVSYGIIKRHGGDVTLKGAAGMGTRVVVRLPVDG